MDPFIKKLIHLTLINNGVTADLKDQKIIGLINAWFFPKYPSITRIIPKKRLINEIPDFIETYQEKLKELNVYFGSWLNNLTGKYYLDLTTTLADLDEAKKTANKISAVEGRQIVSIYNPYLNQTIHLT